MTTPDTKAIRVQMQTEAYYGYQRPETTKVMHNIILSLCYEIDRLRTKNEGLQNALSENLAANRS